jgi:uncharacterized protein
MSRLIFIIVIISLVYWLFKSYRKQPPGQDEPPRTQDMVSCAHCGIHLPKNESLLADGKYYCCAAHSRGQSDTQAGK